jgi:hypothetical protein
VLKGKVDFREIVLIKVTGRACIEVIVREVIASVLDTVGGTVQLCTPLSILDARKS